MEVKEIMKKDLITIDPDAKISEAISKMRENDIQQLPVMSGNKYVAMLTYKTILRRGSVRTTSRVYNFSINTPKIDEKSDVIDAVKLIKESGLNSLPAFSKDKLTGIITRMDIIRNLNGIINNGNSIKNYEIMSSDVITVDEDEDIESSTEKIRSLDEYEIPVSKNGKLTGILRLKDAINNIIMDKQKIRYGEFTSGKSKVEITAKSLMDNSISSTEDANITETSDLMIKNHLHIMPITDRNSKITGIVGIMDILNSMETENEEGFFIEISGLNEDDRDLYDITYFLADKFINNVSKITGNNGKLLFNIRKYKTGGKGKYSIRTKFITPKIHMDLDDADYNYGRCIKNILDKYETRLKEK